MPALVNRLSVAIVVVVNASGVCCLFDIIVDDMNPGAETFTIQLTRDAAGQPWGFRLQGGADFATPLSVQSVRVL